MSFYKLAIGTPGEASHPDAIKAAVAEFFSMLIFVFAGEGSGMAFSKRSALVKNFSCTSTNGQKILVNRLNSDLQGKRVYHDN